MRRRDSGLSVIFTTQQLKEKPASAGDQVVCAALPQVSAGRRINTRLVSCFGRPCDAPTDVSQTNGEARRREKPLYGNLPPVTKKIERFKNGRFAAAGKKNVR